MPVLDKIEAETQVSSPAPEDFQPKQRRRMLIALALLVASLIVVAVKDWQFWSGYLFPPDLASQADTSDDSSAEITTEIPAQVSPTLPPAAKARSHTRAAKASSITAKGGAAAQESAAAPLITTSRAVLPPLQVEVVAGDHHQAVHAGSSNSIKVDLLPPTLPTTSSPAAAPDQTAGQATIVAADRVKISPSAAEVISRPVRPNYPLLARQMKVQGAVVLQALIGKQGSIQDLKVISGPAILSAAAREAVMQWHFKPYFQDGQAVETEARITVNFTISTN